LRRGGPALPRRRHGTSSLVDAAQAHFISAIANVTMPAEVAEFTALDGDLIEGLELVDGAVRVPAGPGLGVRMTV